MIAIGEHEMVLLPRSTPKINGSSGAFVAVVVVLAVIIIVSCLAVCCLVLESRRERDWSHRHHQTAGSRSLEGGFPVGHAPSGMLRSTIGRFLPGHEKKNSAKIEVQNPRRSGQGWVQAAVSDEDLAGKSSRTTHRLGHSTQMSDVFESISRPVSTVPPSIISSPVPYLEPDRERLSSVLSDTAYGSSTPLPDPFSPTPQRSVSNFTSNFSPPSMLPSPSSSPQPSRLATSSPEPISDDNEQEGHVYPSGGGRLFATQSGISMRTFDGGSKFIEVI